MPVFLIAIRNLFGEKGRLLITAGGVAFSVMLILILIGLYNGWNKQMTKFLGSLPADIWIGQRGSGDTSHSVSILPSNLGEELKKVQGVERVTGFVGRRIGVKIDGKESVLSLTGVDQSGVIKPYDIVEGSQMPKTGEVIIDRTFARDKDLTIGDAMDIAGKKFTIAGLSSGGNMLAYTYAFAAEDDLRELFNFQAFTNYFLIQVKDVDGTAVRLRDSFPNLEVMERKEFLLINTSLVREVFLPIIGILAAIAFAIGIAVIGLTIFTATIEKSKEFGVLKAIGYGGGELLSIILIQSFSAGILGFILGNILTMLIVPLAQNAVSSFLYEVGWPEISAVFAATMAISFIAAFIPLKRLSSIDPAQVFKA